VAHEGEGQDGNGVDSLDGGGGVQVYVYDQVLKGISSPGFAHISVLKRLRTS